MNFKELADKIEELAGVDALRLPHIHSVMWFGSTQGPILIKMQDPWPINPDLTVFSIFESDTSYHVYCLAGDKLTEEQKKKIPATLYTLSKASPVYSAASMGLGTFMSEIANELTALDDETSTAERERMLVTQYIRAHPTKLPIDLADDIESGEHEDVDEEEEDDDMPGPAAVPAPVKPS